MKIIKQVKQILFMCIAVLGITGCSLYPDGTINSVEEGSMQVSGDESRHMEGELNDSVSVDADIIIPENTEWKQYTAVERQFTKEQSDKHAQLFIFGTEITDVQETPYRYIYEYSDNSSFTEGTGIINYYTQESEKRNYNLYISGKGKYWTDKKSAFPLEELEELSRSEAVRQVREFCDKLGIELSKEEPEVYVMDAEHMTDIMVQSDTLHYYKTKEQSINEEQGEEIKWTKEDEVYYLIFEINMEGVPLTNKIITTDSIYASKSEVTAVIGKNGLKYLMAGEYLYDITEAQGLEGNICSSADALEVLASAYQYINGFTKMVLTEMKLVYVPIGINNAGERKYTIRPYWQCTMLQEKTTQKDGKTEIYTTESVTLIDAVSKKVFKGTS